MCSFHNPDSQSIGLMKLFWSLIIFEIHTYTVMIVIVIVNMKVMTILEMKILKTTNKNSRVQELQREISQIGQEIENLMRRMG
ncbi:hypothetical protein V6Z11_A02G121400 [Gossypium hirsutum]|uniref:Uncharacterized protein isoform X2 n=1 Tax=Gossypium hirsutum TaxID=3635 RepID=A0ABM2Z9J1_GOSHI|nr:uncharacterized protein LOC107952532 isoform X2 [Gossypium hirsutum]